MNSIILRDPTSESASVLRPRLEPPANLSNSTVALLDIGKMRGDEYIDRLEQLFCNMGVRTKRFRKPTNTRTAPLEMLKQIAAECQVVIIALSDCGSCTSCSTHDLRDLDNRGVAGVSVLTTEFRQPFATQCAAIGFDGASVFIEHPMQNRTSEELHRMADSSFPEILTRVTR